MINTAHMPWQNSTDYYPLSDPAPTSGIKKTEMVSMYYAHNIVLKKNIIIKLLS